MPVGCEQEPVTLGIFNADETKAKAPVAASVQPRFRALANDFLQGNGSGDDKGRRCGKPADGVPDRQKAFPIMCIIPPQPYDAPYYPPVGPVIDRRKEHAIQTPRPRTRTTQFQRQVSWLAGRRVSVQPSRSVCSPRVEIGEATSGRLLLLQSEGPIPLRSQLRGQPRLST